MKVVIGAGPAGLYTAIKLRKAGILDVVVCDPREGHYTRPGHLNLSVFRQAEKGLGIEFWSGEKTGHIKDLERALYAEAKRLNIKFEKKRFLRLHEDAEHPGVVIDNNGAEEIVLADYVFDCTGSRREVVAAVNRVVPDSPLQLTTITDLPVRHHFIAYVKMSREDWDRFSHARDRLDLYPEDMGALSYARSIIKLRTLGWKEFKFPRCYGASFGKDKVCLYFHAPEQLSVVDYESWVQTVLECYTSPIHYEQLPPSPKPRFMPFTSNAEALQKVSYKGQNLPTVIALGDAQIDFDYYLAHGILDGMIRIDALFDHMVIFDRSIHYFDADEYLATMDGLLHDHKAQVTSEALMLKRSFVTTLETAQIKLRQAMFLSSSSDEQQMITAILKEVDARQNYIKAKKLFEASHDSKTQKVKLTPATVDPVIVKLNLIYSGLLKAHEGLLTASFASEQSNIELFLGHMALSWKDIGNELYRNKRFPEAIDGYKKCLEIYNLDCFSGKFLLQELPIYSNLALVYLKNKNYLEAIAAGRTALVVFEHCPDQSTVKKLQEKIIFNLLQAMFAQIDVFLATENCDEARTYHSDLNQLIKVHASEISDENYQVILRREADLKRQLGDTKRLKTEKPSFNPLFGAGLFGGGILKKWGIFGSPSTSENDPNGLRCVSGSPNSQP